MISLRPERLVYLGGVVIDHIYQIDHLPHLGGEVTARSFTRMVGGGFNLMAAAARMDLPVVFAGAHGCGENGTLLRHMLSQEGITVLFQQNQGMDNGHCVVLVTENAERTFITAPGTEACLEREALNALEINLCDWLVTSGYAFAYPKCGEVLAGWIKQLDADIMLVFDPSPVVGDIPHHILQSVLQRTNWLSCNAQEAGIIVGEEINERLVEQVGVRLLQEHCPKAQGVIIRASSQGCYLAMKGAPLPIHIPAFKVDAIDSNGAGDSHLGVFIAALSLGHDIKKALIYANAAAAITVTRRGGATAPRLPEIEAFLREHIGID